MMQNSILILNWLVKNSEILVSKSLLFWANSSMAVMMTLKNIKMTQERKQNSLLN